MMFKGQFVSIRLGAATQFDTVFEFYGNDLIHIFSQKMKQFNYHKLISMRDKLI